MKSLSFFNVENHVNSRGEELIERRKVVPIFDASCCEVSWITEKK